MGVSALWLLLPAGALAAYLAAVAGLVVSGTLLCSRLGRAVPKDPIQARLFSGRSPGWFRLGRALLVESGWQAAAFACQALRAASLLPLPSGPAGGPVVVVVPGYLENAGTSCLLIWRLARAGFRPMAVDYPLSTRGISRNAAWLGDRIAEARMQNGGRPLPVIAHSMGGLVTRTLVLSRSDHGVAALYALCSPFRGTRMALLTRLLGVRGGARDMRPQSDYLKAFSADRVCPVPVVSHIGTLEDVVSPPWSAVVAGADNRVFESPCGHVTPLFDAKAFAGVEAWLRHQCAVA